MFDGIDLQFNYPVLPGQDAEFAALLRLTAASSANLLKPQPYVGNQDDREAGAAWLSREGTAMPAERIALCNGGHHAVYVALLAARLSGAKIAADLLTYPGFKLQAETLGIDLLPCAADGDGMLPEELERAAAAGVKAVFLMPTVHNPLGTVMPLSRREALCEVAQRHGLWIVDDDAYHFVEASPPPGFATLAPELAFSVRSLTKPVTAPLKVAYLAYPQRLSDDVADAIRITSSGVSPVLTSMATSMVLDGSLARLVAAKQVEGSLRVAKAKEILLGAKLQAHPNAFHIWIDLPASRSAASVAEALRADGVLVSPSDDFATVPGAGANGLRVALGAEPDAQRREAALHRVRARILN